MSKGPTYAFTVEMAVKVGMSKVCVFSAMDGGYLYSQSMFLTSTRY